MVKRLDELINPRPAEESQPPRLEQDLAIATAWAEERGIFYIPNGGTFNFDGTTYAPEQLGSMCWVDIHGKRPEKAMRIAMGLYAKNCQQAVEEALRAALPMERTHSAAHLREFVGLMLGIPEPNLDKLDEVAFTQFLWQIKRKVHGALTEWEMMPLFMGGQGFGKTRTLTRLLTSVPGMDAFSGKAQRFTVFTDQFGTAIFHNCFIVPFEEMSGAKNADLEAVKSHITEPEITARMIYTSKFLTLRNRSTFYGTSNLPANASLYDATGMRRFWEFRSTDRSFEAADGERLARIDLRAVWAAVDATGDASPVRPYLAELKARQKATFTATDHFADFLEMEVVADEMGRVPFKAFYAAVCQWYQIQAMKPPSMNTVAQKIEKRGYQKVKPNNVSVYVGIHLIDG